MAKTKKGKISKKKKVGIIGGAAAIGSVIADAVMIAATPMTGGLSLGAFALKKSAEIGIAAAVGATVAGGTAAVVTRKVDSKRITNAYGEGYNEASKVYEAKFTKQAEEFVYKTDEWKKESAERDKTQAEKDKAFKKCLRYIKELEKERDSLKSMNKELSKEKQELLNKLNQIKKEFEAA